jgi:hypothetical protein
VAEHGVVLRGDFRSREKEKVAVELDAIASLVHVISLVQRRPRACSVEKAEVELQHDQRDLHRRIPWLSERPAVRRAA